MILFDSNAHNKVRHLKKITAEQIQRPIQEIFFVINGKKKNKKTKHN